MLSFSCKLALTVVFVLLPLAGETNSATPDSPGYTAMTAQQRMEWFASSTAGPQSMTAGFFSAAIGTGMNTPREYGPHWDGFAQRNGIRLSGIATSNAMEAAIGAFWGVDPRYYPAKGLPIKQRIAHAMKTTFTAPRPDGHYAPAYARFMAVPGSNFLANTWRPDTEADTQHAAMRTLYGCARWCTK